MSPTGRALLRGVDAAAFTSSLAAALRRRGVAVAVTSEQDFIGALRATRPATRTALYWAARVTLVRRYRDLAVFDEVFDAVFGGGALRLDPPSRRQDGDVTGRSREEPVEQRRRGAADDNGLPWATRTGSVPAAGSPSQPDAVHLKEWLPTGLTGDHAAAFDALDEHDLELVQQWLAAALPRWPTRRTRRMRPDPQGQRVLLRQTLARARRTGWEPVRIVRGRPVRRRRRLVLVCDVSRSMQPYAAAYLMMMRAMSTLGLAEVFAFATSLTRLTPLLAQTSPRVAVEQASAAVLDRFGGTRIATNLRALLRSRHGDLLRGAVVVIGSDGWDSDPPQDLATAMARVGRRAHRIVWLNPRAGVKGFEPRVGGMAAALPYCDSLLPARTLQDLARVIDVLVADEGSRVVGSSLRQ